MKVLIISDTHGARSNLDRIVETEKPFDMLLHAGDIQYDEDYIEAVADCPCYFVAGNNDWNAELPYDLVVAVGKNRIFMTHGHGYGLYFGYNDMIQIAKQAGCDTIIHGHTHKPVDKLEQGIRILNPGSVTYPRQVGRQPSYIVAQTGEDGLLNFEHRFL